MRETPRGRNYEGHSSLSGSPQGRQLRANTDILARAYGASLVDRGAILPLPPRRQQASKYRGEEDRLV